MSIIHLVGGEKGGVGKSVVSRLLSQYFLDQSLPFTALDADQSHSTLTRSYSDYTNAVNLDQFESADQIMEKAIENDQQVLIDLPAQSERFLERWMEENGVLEMCDETGVTLVFWYVVDDGRDSTLLLDQFLTKYQNRMTCIVVKNQGRGSDFSHLDQLAGASYDNVMMIDLPALHSPTMRKIDKQSFSFWAAAHVKEGEGHLGMMERQRVRVWQSKAYSAFKHVFDQLPDTYVE